MTLRQLPLRTIAGLLVLAASAFVAVTSEMLPTGLLPQIARGLHVTTAHAGSLVAFYGLIVALGSVPLAALTISLPRKALVTATVAGYSISGLLVAFADSYSMAVVARVVGGVSHALFFAVAAAYVTRLVPRPLVGKAVAATMSGGSLATLVGVPLGTAIGLGVGWRVAFLVLASAGLLLLVVAIVILPGVPSSDRLSTREVFAGLRTPGLAAVGALAAVSFGAQFTAFTYVSPLLHRGGLSGSGVAASLLVFGIAGMIGVWLAGARANTHPTRVVATTSIALALTLFGIWASAGSAVPTVLLTFVWGVAFGVLPAYLMNVGLGYGRLHPDISAAAVNSACNVGIVAGSVFGGIVFRRVGLHAVPLATVCVCAGGVLLLAAVARFLPRLHHEDAESTAVETSGLVSPRG